MAPNSKVTRRDFVKDAGGLLIGFSLAESAVLPRVLAAAVPESIAAPSPNRLDSWLRIGKDGIVQVFTGKPEIGMGVSTAYAQIVAEELDVPFDRVRLVMADTASTTNQGGVGGSTSIMLGAKPLRNAAANARYLLVQSASRRLGVPADELEVKDGVVRVKGAASKKRFLRGTGRRWSAERYLKSFRRRIFSERGRHGQAQGPLDVHDCRKARAAHRSAAKNSRPIQVCRRRARSRNAARARDPSIGSGCNVCERG